MAAVKASKAKSPSRSWRLDPRARLARLRPIATYAFATVAALSIVGLAVPAAYQWIKHHSYFALADVSVRGLGRVSREELLGWAGIRFGASTWEIDPVAVESRLEQEPWIQRAQVRVELPNRLVIVVHERKPMALARLDNLYYVDRRGHLLGPLRDEDSRDFPIITGLDDEQGWNRARMALPRAAQLIRWCERRHCFDMISEVKVDRNQLLTIYPMQPQVAVILGWGHWEQKIERLRRVWATYEGHEAKLASVDLSYPGAAVVRLKQEATTPVPTPGRKTRV